MQPLRCSSQFGGVSRSLGTYEMEKDAARAYDKVARILGRRSLNFPNSESLEIDGPRSEGADNVVAAVVEEAKKFVKIHPAPPSPSPSSLSGKSTSKYKGVNVVQRSGYWASVISVSPSRCNRSNRDIYISD